MKVAIAIWSVAAAVMVFCLFMAIRAGGPVCPPGKHLLPIYAGKTPVFVCQ